MHIGCPKLLQSWHSSWLTYAGLGASVIITERNLFLHMRPLLRPWMDLVLVLCSVWTAAQPWPLHLVWDYDEQVLLQWWWNLCRPFGSFNLVDWTEVLIIVFLVVFCGSQHGIYRTFARYRRLLSYSSAWMSSCVLNIMNTDLDLRSGSAISWNQDLNLVPVQMPGSGSNRGLEPNHGITIVYSEKGHFF